MQTVTVTVQYAVGDLVNGDYGIFNIFENAQAAYEKDAWEGARAAQENQQHYDDERQHWDFDDFLAESREFHYISKVTTTTTLDQDGDQEVTEDREII